MQKIFYRFITLALFILPAAVTVCAQAAETDLPSQPASISSNLSRKPRFETIDEIIMQNGEVLITAAADSTRSYSEEKIYYVYREILPPLDNAEGNRPRYSGLVDVVFLKKIEDNTLYFQPVWIGGSVNFEPEMLLVEGNFDFSNSSAADISGSPGMSMKGSKPSLQVHLGSGTDFSSIGFFSGVDFKGGGALSRFGVSLFVSLPGDIFQTDIQDLQAYALYNIGYTLFAGDYVSAELMTGLYYNINPSASYSLEMNLAASIELTPWSTGALSPVGISVIPYVHAWVEGWQPKLAVSAFYTF